MIKKKTIRIVSSLFLIAALCVGCPQPNGGDGNVPKNTVEQVLEDLGLSEEGEKTGTDEEIKTISESLKKQGLEELKKLLEEMLLEDQIYVERLYPYEKAGMIATIRQHGQVVEEEYLPEGIAIKAYVPMEVYPKI